MSVGRVGRLCLTAVVLALLFAVLASVAPAATVGGASYVPPAPSGGADYGVAVKRIDARPIAATLALSARRVRVGTLPGVRFRIRQHGSTTVRVTLRVYRAATRTRARDLTLKVAVGRVRVGHERRVRWPRRAKLPTGRYLVSLHATDPAGRTLARSAQWPGQTTLTVLPKPKPKPKKPKSAPVVAAPVTPQAAAPAPVTPISDGVFPVTGTGWTFGGADARFGAQRSGHTHQGQDVTAPAGTPVVSPVAGTVTAVDFQRGGAGYYVVIHGADGRDLFLCHFQKGTTTVAVGQAVAPGTPIARVGATGDASGPHLHFEIWVGGWGQGEPVDPLPQLRTWAGM